MSWIHEVTEKLKNAFSMPVVRSQYWVRSDWSEEAAMAGQAGGWEGCRGCFTRISWTPACPCPAAEAFAPSLLVLLPRGWSRAAAAQLIGRKSSCSCPVPPQGHNLRVWGQVCSAWVELVTSCLVPRAPRAEQSQV